MSKVLRVNTTKGTLKTEDIKKSSQYFGGRGLVAKIMTDEVDPHGRRHQQGQCPARAREQTHHRDWHLRRHYDFDRSPVFDRREESPNGRH